MEEAEQELKELEAELRSLAAHELRPREEDAALLARLMERADAACCPRAAKPWYSRYSTWGASAAVACLAVLFIFAQAWYSTEPVVSALQEGTSIPRQHKSEPCSLVAVDSIPAQIQELPQMPLVAGGAPAPAPVAVYHHVRSGSAPCETAVAVRNVCTPEEVIPQSAPVECSIAGGGIQIEPDAVQQESVATSSYSSGQAIYSSGVDMNDAVSVDEAGCEDSEMEAALDTALAVQEVKSISARKAKPAFRAKRKSALPAAQVVAPKAGDSIRKYVERCIQRVTSADR